MLLALLIVTNMFDFEYRLTVRIRTCLKAAMYPITKFWVPSSFQATKQDFTSYWSQSENK